MMSPAAWLQTWHSDGVHVGSAELLYYRSKVAAFAQLQRQRPPRSHNGAVLSKRKGRGMEFDEVRHYQAGDDVRSIDWRVTARTGTVHTKLFREERERPVLFVLDLSHAMHFGSALLLKSVQACHVVAALAWRAVQRGDRVGLLIGSAQGHSELRPQARQHGVMRIIQQLVQQQQQSLSSWQQHDSVASADQSDVWGNLLQRTQQLVKPGTRIYLLSDWAAQQPQHWPLIQALRAHCQVQAVQLFDPLERQLPAQLSRFNLSLTDAQRLWRLPAYDASSRQQFEQRMSAQQQQFEQAMQQHGIALSQVTAAQPLEQQWPELRL